MGVLRGLTGAAKSAINKRGRLKASEKAALTKAAKQNDMSVTEFRKAAKADLASEAGEGTASDKAVAKRLKISVAELQKKRKAAKKKKKTPKKWTRSKRERTELARLKSQQRKEDLGDQFKGAGMHGGRREETVMKAPGSKGLQRPLIVESPSGRLKSKQILDTDDWTKTEKFRQKRQPHADPQSQIAEAMGLRGEGSLPTAEEARALGLTVKKGGGIVVDAKFGKFVKGLISKAKKVVSPKKKPVVAKKKPVKKPTGIRRKLQGKSATDIHKAYTIPEINKMKKNLGQAGTPDSKLIRRLDKAIAVRKKVKQKSSSQEARKTLGLISSDLIPVRSNKKGSGKKTIGGSKKPKAKKIDPWLKGKGREEGWWLSSDREKGGPVIKRKKPGPVKIKVLKPGPKPKEEKWGKRYGHRKGQSAFGKKSGGAIKRNRGGAVRGVGKANRGFGNAQYSKKLY